MGGSFWRRRTEVRIRAAQQEHEQPRDERRDEEPRQKAEARPAQRGAGSWRNLVEQRIQDGIERGLFDNLSGAGKPLNLDEDALVPEDMRMAFRLLRSNGLAPLWVELNKEIREDLQRLERFRAHVAERWDRANLIQLEHFRQQHAGRVRDINDKIVNYNILAPSSLVHFPTLIVDDEIAKFDAITKQ